MLAGRHGEKIHSKNMTESDDKHDLVEPAHISVVGEHLDCKPSHSSSSRERTDKLVIKRDTTIISENMIAATIGNRPEKRSFPRPRFARRIVEVDTPPAQTQVETPKPRPPSPNPPKPEEESVLKTERARFTVSSRGTLIWHDAKNDKAASDVGAAASDPAPFGTRRARPSEVVTQSKPHRYNFEFLTSLQESTGSNISSELPSQISDAQHGYAVVAHATRQYESPPVRSNSLANAEETDKVSIRSTTSTHMKEAHSRPGAMSTHSDLERLIREDSDEPPVVGAEEDEEGSVLILDSNKVMQVFVPLLLEQAGLVVGTICESIPECSLAVSSRNSHLAYVDREEAYEYVFISYNDILIANVDNLSEGLMKDTEEENKVLHFVYNFKKQARAEEHKAELLKKGA